MATRGHLGGLSLAVPDAIHVAGAAGFATLVVETVGVGQMEVDIAASADTTVVVTNPGWGDAMQANKAGLLEVADIFVINKADRAGLRETRRDLEQMLDLGGERSWRPPILETIAQSGQGTEAVWAAVNEHRAHQASSGDGARRRTERIRRELGRVLAVTLESRIRAVTAGPTYEAVLDDLARGDLDPYAAADQLLGDA
jgi:LAO/AO transport system kinase